MKRRLFSWLLFILIAALCVFLLAQGDGYLLIAYGSRTIEMTLWIAALSVIALILALWLIKQLLAGGVHIARRFHEMITFGSVERAQKRASNGMVDFFIGDWAEARKKLIRTMERVEFPLPYYLAAARASFEMGDAEEAERILDRAKKFDGGIIPVDLMRARILLTRGEKDEAFKLVKPLQLAHPRHPAVLDVYHHVLEAQHNWSALQEIFPDLRKARVLSQPELARLEVSLALHKLEDVAKQVQQKLIAERLPYIEQVWRSFSKSQQQTPEVVNAYANVLIQNYQDQLAEPLVRRTLNERWYTPLVETYGRIEIKELRNQVRTAETWMKEYPNDPVLLLTMARLHKRLGQLETARDYALKSVRLAKNIDAATELADIYEKLGDTKSSIDAYRQSLQLTHESHQ